MSYIVQKAIEPDDLSAKQAAAFNSGVECGRYLLQPKIDGCHVVLLFDAFGALFQVRSSTGEVVKSCDHLAQDTFPAGLTGRPYALLGEVTIPGEEFRNISGAFRRQAPQPQLRALYFDVVNWSYDLEGNVVLEDPRPYNTRYRQLQAAVGDLALPVLMCMSRTSADILAQEYQQIGFAGSLCDGAVLRNSQAPYIAKRCRDAEVVKVKPLLDFDMEVIGVDLAKGEKTGKNTGALVVRFLNGVHLRVATGMTQADVDRMHATGGEAFIGKIVRVQALGHTGTGSLREPRYLGIRTDKDKPDF